MKPHHNWSVLVILLFTFVSCDTWSGLPKGEAYEDVTGQYRIVVQSENEVDVIEKGSAYRGEYLLQEDGRVRIAVTILGTAMVQYYSSLAEGLQQVSPSGEPGGILYDRAHIAAPRNKYYCGLVSQEVAELRAAQSKLYGRERRYAVEVASGARLHTPRHGVRAEFLGVPRRYYVLHVTHDECDMVYIYFNALGGEDSFFEREDARQRWAALKEQAARDTEEDLKLQAAEEEASRRRAEEEAARLAARIQESKRATRTLGRFSASRPERNVDVTDVSIGGWKGLDERGWTSVDDTLWLCELAANSSYRYATKINGDKAYHGYYKVRIDLRNFREVDLEFSSLEERNSFLETVVAAASAWHEKYGDFVSNWRCPR